jgi:hypothetical protein
MTEEGLSKGMYLGGSTSDFPRSFFWTSVMACFGESTLFFALVVVGGLQTKMMKIFAPPAVYSDDHQSIRELQTAV